MTSFESYKEFIKDEGPRFALFSASWCKPCGTLKPLLETIKNNCDSFNYIVIDVDEDKEIMEQYKGDVRSVPLLCNIDKDLKVSEYLIGSNPKSRIEAFLQKNGVLVC